MQDQIFKVSIVGCGRVGMAAAFAMLIKGQVTQLVLWGREIEKVKGEKLDLDEAGPLLPKAEIIATDDWNDLKDSDLVVFSAGASQRKGQTRMDLAKQNVQIVEELIPKILAVAPGAAILVVTNPVDVLTYKANQLGGVREGQIFGSGTMLDTMRFRHYLSQALGVDAHNIHAYVLGEHGDNSFPVYEFASIGAQRLLDFPGAGQEVVEGAFEKAKDAAYKIIDAKGATYYAIGMVISRIAQAVRADEKVILPLSVPLSDYKGLSGVAISVPCLLGRKGVEEVLMVDLSDEEEEKLRQSTMKVKEYC